MRLLSPTLLATALIAGLVSDATAIELSEPKPVPVVIFESLDGEETSIADFAGKTVVLNFWATWCAPCKREMPSLGRLQAAFDDEEVVVIALAADRAEPDKLQSWMDDIGVENLQIYRDPKLAVVRAMTVPGLPVTLIIDADGNEVARHQGFTEWDTPEIIELISQVSANTQ